jgi:hypothetical protein
MNTNESKTSTGPSRRSGPGKATLLTALLAITASTNTLLAQSNSPKTVEPQAIERLRRDQDEIMRKAESLKKLMTRLMTRYQRENKQEQVDYLKEGLKHLDRSGILRDVATIREDLEATAFTEALRKQKEVVNDLERLLNILLARKSIENIDEEVKAVAKQAQTAAELERRQRDLITETREMLKSELSEAEQKLADEFADMRDAEQREADRNSQQAGMRRPFLESALDRIKQLLNGQEQLEEGLQDEAAGRTPEAKTQAFDLGDLSESVRRLQRDLRNQEAQQDLGQAGKDMQAAAASEDEQALQQARDHLDRLLENAPTLPKNQGEFESRDETWQQIRKAGQEAPETDTKAGQEALDQVGQDAEQHAAKRNDEATDANSSRSDKLGDAAKALAERLQQSAPATTPDQEGEQSADAVANAAKELDAAKAAIDKGDTKKATEMVNKALSSLDKARAKHRKENPDAARNAAQMAAEARATAQALGNAPIQEDAEQQAQQDLDKAAQALRDVAKEVEDARNEAKTPDPEQTAKAAAESRKSLENAQQSIQKALDEAAANNEAELQAAAQRQQELADQVQKAAQQMQQAAQDGDINKQQQQQAQKSLDQAQKRMQNAKQQLQKGQQSGAAQQQQQAAEDMQQAMDALQENRELTPEQKEQLADQAKEQEQLTEDIIKLAEELKKRRNKAAERAAEEAADASRKAQRAMEQGDTDETQKQQDKARQKLEEATEQLEEEKDRYQDLRQEELLFKMKDELTAFMEKQRPITEAIKQIQQVSGNSKLSRPARRKVNGLGEEEQGLAGKVEFLVNALSEEGNLVYRSVLNANLEDLREVARRLAGRSPDVGSFTTLLQDDVEQRTLKLLDALAKELKRRNEERQQQQQDEQSSQPESKNKFNKQRQKLVSLIAELEMLKNLDIDTKDAADNLRTFVEVRSDETISDAEVAMIQRLAHRHNEITKLFAQIKAGVEEAMSQMGGGEEEEGGSGR